MSNMDVKFEGVYPRTMTDEELMYEIRFILADEFKDKGKIVFGSEIWRAYSKRMGELITLQGRKVVRSIQR